MPTTVLPPEKWSREAMTLARSIGLRSGSSVTPVPSLMVESGGGCVGQGDEGVHHVAVVWRDGAVLTVGEPRLHVDGDQGVLRRPDGLEPQLLGPLGHRRHVDGIPYNGGDGYAYFDVCHSPAPLFVLGAIARGAGPSASEKKPPAP